MSALVRTWRGHFTMSALPPKTDIHPLIIDVRFVPIADIAPLFDHLISEKQKRPAYREAKSFCCFEIDDEFELIR